MEKLLVLVSGKAGSGKDAFVHGLREEGMDFMWLAFADALKDMARVTGWDGKKKDERGRRLLQDLGSAWRRYDPLFWIRKVQNMAECVGCSVVVSDCRFRNELEEMKSFGERLGFRVATVRVERPGYDNGLTGEAAAHESETDLDGQAFDVTVFNEQPTVEEFKRVSAAKFMAFLEERTGGGHHGEAAGAGPAV